MTLKVLEYKKKYDKLYEKGLIDIKHKINKYDNTKKITVRWKSLEEKQEWDGKICKKEVDTDFPDSPMLCRETMCLVIKAITQLNKKQ